jgi:hypothetical protein
MGDPALTASTPPAASCCDVARAFVVAEGRPAECPTCGTVYLPDDAPDAARPSRIETRPRRRTSPPLAEVIAAVRLALAWRREHDVDRQAPPVSPLARMQGRSDGTTDDATASTAGALWRLVTDPSGKVGRRARSGFVDALLRHCDETSRPLADAPDWVVARAHAARLAALDAPHRAALVAVARRADASVAWDVAALIVADECAPSSLRVRWTSTRARALDRTTPPPELSALAWGETALREALAAWGLAGA